MAVFALGIMFPISASIIIQLMTTVFPELEALKKSEAGRRSSINIPAISLRAGVIHYGIAVGWSISAARATSSLS